MTWSCVGQKLRLAFASAGKLKLNVKRRLLKPFGDTPRILRPACRPRRVSAALLPYPHGLRHLQIPFWWKPDVPGLTLAAAPEAMLASQAILLQRTREHATIVERADAKDRKIPPLTAQLRQAAKCCEFGFCSCHQLTTPVEGLRLAIVGAKLWHTWFPRTVD